VDFGIAGIRAQPVNRPRLNLARCEGQVHGGGSHLQQGGQAKRAAKSGSDRVGIRDVGENKKRPRGLSSGRNFPMMYR
jgi:hypothetical protein